MYSQAFPAVTALWSPTSKNNIIQIIKFKNQFFLSTLPDYERATNILGTGTLRLAHLTLVERAHTRHHTSAPCAMFSVDLATASTDIGQTVCVCVCALYADTHFEFTFLFRWFCAYHIYHRPTNQEFGENKSVYASINFPIWVLALDSKRPPAQFSLRAHLPLPECRDAPNTERASFCCSKRPRRVASYYIRWWRLEVKENKNIRKVYKHWIPLTLDDIYFDKRFNTYVYLMWKNSNSCWWFIDDARSQSCARLLINMNINCRR